VYRRTEPESAAGHASADDDLLTAAEVAALLRMTPAWVYAETRRNRIPHMRLGRYFRYRRSTIDDWMSQLETGTDPAGRLPSSQPKLGRLPTGVSSSRGR
jgi:excisionase family DNA binding protein